MKSFGAALLIALIGAATAPAADDASAILARLRAHRPARDLALKARLFLTRERFIPVDILIHYTTVDTRTIYRYEQTELLVCQPLAAEPRFYRKGVGELTGTNRLEKLFGSHFVLYDLGLPFLGWPNPKLTGAELSRGRDCLLIETQAADQPYARVKMWVDKEYNALLRAEAFNADDQLLRRLLVTSFKRIGDVWIPRGLESMFIPPGQALPAAERSRLEIDTANEDAHLAAELFDPQGFGVVAIVPGAGSSRSLDSGK